MRGSYSAWTWNKNKKKSLWVILLVFFIWLLKFYISKALLATALVRENRSSFFIK